MVCSANYTTVAEVKAYVIDGSVVDLSAFTDDQICNAILMSEAMVESITNDIFYLKSEAVIVDGTGYTSLWFYPTTPYRVVTITSVEQLYTNRTTQSSYTENTAYIKYAYYLTLDGWTIRTTRSDDSWGNGVKGVWTRGNKNYKITATWGRTTTPVEITDVVIKLTLEKLVHGSTGMSTGASGGVSSAEWDDFTITMSGESEWSLGKDTGYVEVDRVLRRYINYVDMFYESGDGS